MNIVIGIIVTAFVIFVAIMSFRQGKQNRGRTYEQRRDELYNHYEDRMREFKQTEAKSSDTSKQD